MEHVLTRDIPMPRIARRIIGVSIFVILTALAGFVRVGLPMTPVPLTLQTAVVLLSGVCLGRLWGCVSQIGFAALGVMGVPLFSVVGSGLLYILGPTGGYMAGFVLASFIVGSLVPKCNNNISKIIAVFLLADLVILLCGMFWLKNLTACSWDKAFMLAVAPFIFGDIIKASSAALIYTKFKPRLTSIFV